MANLAPSPALENLPDWFLNPPNIAGGIVEAASAVAGDLQLALDKALLDAKYRIAERLRSQVSGQISQFIEETGQAGTKYVRQESSKVVSSLFTDINMGGYRVVRQKVMAEGGRYRAYVLVEFPLQQAGQALVQAVQANPVIHESLAASPGFKALASPGADLVKGRNPP